MKLLSQFLDLLFPPKCPFCGKILDAPGICPACRAALPWVPDGETVRELPGGVRCAAPLWYGGLAREGLLRFKFQGHSAAARTLGELIAQCAAEHFGGEFDTVTWVPVSRKRLRQRGYDQAELLARRVGEVTGLPVTAALVKTRNTKAQSSLDADDSRKANVQGVYACRPGVDLAGKRVILVDDVATSGSTLAECAACLRKAGAVSVVALTLARAR